MSLQRGDQSLTYALRFEAEETGVKGTLVSPRSGEHPVESTSIDTENVTLRIQRKCLPSTRAVKPSQTRPTARQPAAQEMRALFHR